MQHERDAYHSSDEQAVSVTSLKVDPRLRGRYTKQSAGISEI